MPTRIFLLRHAESADPTVFHGAESDIGLSERGVRQAAEVAAYLATRRPDRVISSAMRRARETAAPIAQACGVPHLIEPGLHERKVGAMSGKPRGTGEDAWPETLRRWQAGETNYASDGAESYDAMCHRLLPIWERIVRTYAEQTTVVVAHGVVCKVLLLNILPGLSIADWQRLGPIANVVVMELIQSGDGPWQLLTRSDS